MKQDKKCHDPPLRGLRASDPALRLPAMQNAGIAALELELIKSLRSPVRPLEKRWAARMKREARQLLKQR